MGVWGRGVYWGLKMMTDDASTPHLPPPHTLSLFPHSFPPAPPVFGTRSKNVLASQKNLRQESAIDVSPAEVRQTPLPAGATRGRRKRERERERERERVGAKREEEEEEEGYKNNSLLHQDPPSPFLLPFSACTLHSPLPHPLSPLKFKKKQKKKRTHSHTPTHNHEPHTHTTTSALRIFSLQLPPPPPFPLLSRLQRILQTYHFLSSDFLFIYFSSSFLLLSLFLSEPPFSLPFFPFPR